MFVLVCVADEMFACVADVILVYLLPLIRREIWFLRTFLFISFLSVELERFVASNNTQNIEFTHHIRFALLISILFFRKMSNSENQGENKRVFIYPRIYISMDYFISLVFPNNASVNNFNVSISH